MKERVVSVFFFIFLFLAFLPSAYSKIIVNEIMPNPPCYGDSCEWIELYNSENQSFFLNGTLAGKEINYPFQPNEYLVLTQTLTGKGSFESLYGNNDSIWNESDGNYSVRNFSSLSLPNEGKCLNLTYSNFSQEVCYNKSQVKENYSLEWNGSTFLFSLIEKGTPGKENSVIQKQDFDNNSKNLSSDLGNESNQTTNLSCEVEINIFLTNQSFAKPEDFGFQVMVKKIFGEKTRITVTGMITNADNEIAKSYSPWKETSLVSNLSKTYSPNLARGEYLISFQIDEVFCEDINLSNNQKVYQITIGEGSQKKEEDSFLEINDYDDLIWGEEAEVEIFAYRGNTNRYSLKLFLEDEEGNLMSKIAKTKITSKFSNLTETLDLPLKECPKKKTNNYYLVLEGLGLREEKEVKINGCSKEEIKNNFSSQILSFSKIVLGNEKIKFKLKIKNDQQESLIRVFPYLYKKDKIVAKGLEQGFILNANEEKFIESEIANDNLDEGNYQLVIEIEKEKKSSKLKEEIKIVKEGKTVFGSKNESKKSVDSSKAISKTVVYQSNTYQIKKLLPVFIMLVLGLACLILIIRRL